MNILHLTLKRQWFDMILSGEKKEEYREIKPYWINRLLSYDGPKESKDENVGLAESMMFDFKRHEWQEVLKGYYSKFKPFDAVKLINGYSPTSPSLLIECKGIEIGLGQYHWGAPLDKKVFIIKLGNILLSPNQQ